MYTIIFLKGKQIFEYDSDGEALNFKNYSIISFFGKESRDEFPKYKLISYDILNAILFNRLYIKINSKKKRESILKYDISYLSSKEIKDLRLSLNKIVRENKQYL